MNQDCVQVYNMDERSLQQERSVEYFLFAFHGDYYLRGSSHHLRNGNYDDIVLCWSFAHECH